MLNSRCKRCYLIWDHAQRKLMMKDPEPVLRPGRSGASQLRRSESALDDHHSTTLSCSRCITPWAFEPVDRNPKRVATVYEAIEIKWSKSIRERLRKRYHDFKHLFRFSRMTCAIKSSTYALQKSFGQHVAGDRKSEPINRDQTRRLERPKNLGPGGNALRIFHCPRNWHYF